jgi:hypothetical protein
VLAACGGNAEDITVIDISSEPDVGLGAQFDNANGELISFGKASANGQGPAERAGAQLGTALCAVDGVAVAVDESDPDGRFAQQLAAIGHDVRDSTWVVLAFGPPQFERSHPALMAKLPAIAPPIARPHPSRTVSHLEPKLKE